MQTSSEAATGIRQVARDLLGHGLEHVVAASTALIFDEEPAYLEAQVPRADLARATRRTLSLTLHRLAGLEVPEELRSAAFETGLRRAEQGLSLASLLHSFRIDLRLLWDVITQEGRRLENRERLAILEQHTLLWEALEANTADVVEAYRVVEERRAQRLHRRDRELFKRFVADGEHHVETLEAFAAHSGLPVDGRYLTFVVTGLSDARETATVLHARLRTGGHRPYLTVHKKDLHGLVLERPDRPVGLEVLAGASSEGSAAAVHALQLAGVPRSLRVARRVARARRPGSVAHIDEAPLDQLSVLERELIETVLDDRLRGLDELDPAEAAGIWETVEALVASDGTITDIAARTFRHRNTVRSRIDRLHKVTGLDSCVPSHAVILALAVARRRTGFFL